MSVFSAVTEKQATGVAGAISAALIEAGLSPGSALLGRIADLATGAAAFSRPGALALAFAILGVLAIGAQAYVRPLSRKAAFASGFCAVAVLALFAP